MPPRPWTVTPHDPIEKLEANLWCVDGSVPGPMPLRRRAAFVRLADGRLVIHNAMPLEEPVQQEIERWGKPAFLVVPNGFHRLDVHAYKARYPELQVVCPPHERKKVEERVAVDGAFDLLPADPSLRVEVLDGSKIGEGVLVATSPDGARHSLIWGDSYFNVPARLPGFFGFLVYLLGSTGGPRVTRIARWFTVGDRARLRAHLERLAELPGLARLIPSHGVITETDAPATLRTAAATL